MSATETLLSELSNAMVALYKDQLGRGPTRARADWAGENTLVVTLEDSLTRAEHRLVEMGEDARLRDQRTFSQYATIDRFVEIAERLTGRQVRAFVSGIDTQADVCSEVFYLGPVVEQSRSTSALGHSPNRRPLLRETRIGPEATPLR